MKNIFFILLIFSIIACKNSKIPKYTLDIPKEKMIAIMIDLHVAEIAIQEFLPDQQDSMKTIFVTQIFKIHKTDKAKFESNFKKLIGNAELNSSVQTEVLDSVRSINEKYKLN
jgi:Domain of unknown function (DUF4296)